MKIAIISMVLVLAMPIYAQLGSQSFGQSGTNGEIDAANFIFSNPGMLPDNPLYFLKRIGENVQLALADQKTQQKLHTEFAVTRLAEAKKLAQTNPRLAAGQLGEFRSELEKINNTDSHMADTFEKGDVVLADILNKTSDGAVQQAILRAMEKRMDAMHDKGQARQRLEVIQKRLNENAAAARRGRITNTHV